MSHHTFLIGALVAALAAPALADPPPVALSGAEVAAAAEAAAAADAADAAVEAAAITWLNAMCQPGASATAPAVLVPAPADVRGLRVEHLGALLTAEHLRTSGPIRVGDGAMEPATAALLRAMAMQGAPGWGGCPE